MTELKAGGLAIVISSPVEDNIGKVVSLVRFIGGFTSPYNGESGTAWEVESRKPLTLPDGRPCDKGLIFSHKLLPIDDEDFSKEDEIHKELTHG